LQKIYPVIPPANWVIAQGPYIRHKLNRWIWINVLSSSGLDGKKIFIPYVSVLFALCFGYSYSPGLFQQSGPTTADTMGTILRLSEISTDKPLTDSLYDSNGIMVLERGSRVTIDLLKGFAQRGLKFLELGEPEDDPLFSQQGDPEAVQSIEPKIDAAHTVAATSHNAVVVEQPPARVNSGITNPKLSPYRAEAAERIDSLARRAVEVVNELGTALASGTLRDAGPIHEVADNYLRELSGDTDHVVSETMTKPGDRDLALRSVQMSVLGMAICRAMNLPESDQATVGAAAMLHDMALFRLPESERFPHPLMKPESRQVYEWHPAIAYDMLEKVRETDGTTRLIVLQTHEQADGSGFPRRITLPRIHRLARVLNVVDTYIRLVGCGCDGQRIFPADAMAYLMHHSCAGRFDPEVTCGLIKVVSLYPLGSLVTLSNSKAARVVRSNPGSPLKPIVMIDGEHELVDLSESDLDVQKPEDNAELGRRRLPSGEFDRVLW
jgi:HD-GYP domain-containing protein (c-di-GMP phosphodiesterase class II)